MSFIAPSLPENAPFSAPQRAWLDGFLAGLWSDGEIDSDASGSPSSPGLTGLTGLTGLPRGSLEAAADDRVKPGHPSGVPSEPEDFPWHDPGIPLDERIALATGRGPARLLMAAMAQTDCGQCGYACQTYAEAIASGADGNIARCTPGGKATSRKLKELLAEIAGSAPTAAASTPASAAAAPALPRAPHQPFPARLRAAQRLNRSGSEKDTRLVVLETETRAGRFEVGDSLGVVARNCPELVAAIIARLRVATETPVLSPDGTLCPLADALSQSCEIRRPSDQAIEVLSSRAHDLDESRILQAMAEGYPGAGPDDADLLDLLESFPSARPPLSELISALDPLQPRLYSIASSPKYAAGEVHLTVAAVRYHKRTRRRTGVASTYLCDRVAPGGEISVYVHPAAGFRLAAPDRPMIMIGPGTGIAPFRAFLQERQAIGARARNWLVFGNPHRDKDYLFEDELTAWHRDGLLTRLDTAFSRDQEHKIYVQHRLLENAAELWAWLEEGAHLYVCGDAERMARDVDRGLLYIIAKEGCMEPAAAKTYLARLAAEGRYQRDVY
ncbi:MAG TPA: sulfite reductase subunit alpha [Stellaceae bacterium]|nr:sulfite reductase subunit alpha [Stellaceae bacterium]